MTLDGSHVGVEVQGGSNPSFLSKLCDFIKTSDHPQVSSNSKASHLVPNSAVVQSRARKPCAALLPIQGFGVRTTQET